MSKQLQIYPNNKTMILVNFAWWYGVRFNWRRSQYEGREDYTYEINLPFINIDYCWDPVEPTLGWDSKFDLMFDLKTLEYVESICKCEPGTCEFTDAYIKAGSPTSFKKEGSFLSNYIRFV